MRRVLIVLSTLVALGASLVPRAGEAEMLCQSRKSKKIYRMEACTGRYRFVYDLGSVSQVQAQLDALKGQLAALEDQVEQGIAPGSVTKEKMAADAIDASKIEDASLGFDELGFWLLVPYPANGIGNHGRVVAAKLDMSEVDGDGVSVENQTGAEWLTLRAFDTTDVWAEFQINADVFESPPHCVAGVSDAGSPDAPSGLEASIAAVGTPAAYHVRVRVTGANRSFDVLGTLLCFGVARP